MEAILSEESPSAPFYFDLGFDYELLFVVDTERASHIESLLSAESHMAKRDGNTVAMQNLSTLILMQLHISC